jgi:hypothetical protein
MLDARAAADPEFDLDTAIANILWHEARRYRVSITIGEPLQAWGAKALHRPRAARNRSW